MELLNALSGGSWFIDIEIKPDEVIVQFDGHLGYGSSIEDAFLAAVDNYLGDYLVAFNV